MKTQFRILFTLSISHSYYQAGCKDFDFLVPADTAQLLRNGKRLPKVRDGKLYILLETDENGAAIKLEGKTLRFGLKLLDPFFSNFTDFNFNSSTPVYRNATNPTNLDAAREINLVGSIFSHALINTVTGSETMTVTLQSANGRIYCKLTLSRLQITVQVFLMILPDKLPAPIPLQNLISELQQLSLITLIVN